MAILVTGGAGYIGSHTVVELLDNNYEVVVVDNFSNSKSEVLKRIKKITSKNFAFYKVDILDQQELSTVFDQNDIELVIHFAAYKAVGESVEKPLKYYHNNIGGTVSLLQVMKQHGVKNIIFSSSATVYGADNPVPFVEDMPISSASNPYGYTKVVNEQLLQDLVKSDSEWSVSLLRYFNPIGAHETGLIGEDPQGIPNNLMPYITQVAIGKRSMLQVYGNDYNTPDGTGVRDYIHVVDLAKGHVQAIQNNLNQQGVAIYNLGTGKGCSVLDLINAFKEANGIDIPYQIVERRPGDIASAYADPSRAEKVLSWTADKDIIDMCRDSWHWQNLNPNGYEGL